MDYDVIIAGLGAMGSATAYHCATKGLRVLGLDRFQPPHSFGSSHGLSRIIREAYFEHPLYVPLVQRAYSLWADLEKQSGHQLLQQTGGLMIGPPEGILVSGARRSAIEHSLHHELLSAVQLRQRFGAFCPPEDVIAVWEPRAGILFPECAIQSHLELAARKGARLRYNEPVLRWEPLQNGVRVVTASGDYTSRRLLLSPGAWITSLVPELKLPLTVERQIQFWFEPREVGRKNPPARSFDRKEFPIFIWEYEPIHFCYGFPDLGDGVKFAFHHQGTVTEPDNLHRDVLPAEIDAAQILLKRFLPAVAGRFKSAVACMYTNTPDEHFIIDVHPQHSQVIVASPCSGHGFKFSPVIGEVAACLLSDETPAFDLTPFKLSRFCVPPAGIDKRGPQTGRTNP